MIKVIRKKVIILCVMGLMLMGVGFITYHFNDTSAVSNEETKEYVPIGETKMVSATPDEKNTEDNFKKMRINRETQRSASIDLLNEMINNTSSTPESKKDAEEKLADMSINMECEANCEGLVIAKGFKDCIVYVNEDAVNVVVKTDSELTGTDTAKIRDIIYEQTKNNNIKIVAVE